MPINRGQTKSILKRITQGIHLGIIRPDLYGNLVQHHCEYSRHGILCISKLHKDLIIISTIIMILFKM